MTPKEINEGNVLIAEFMGYKYHGGHNEIWKKSDGEMFRGGESKFHKSWDWLMTVVEKIGRELYQRVTISTTFTRIHTSFANEIEYKNFTVSIECTWLAVVDFIKWHNSKAK